MEIIIEHTHTLSYYTPLLFSPLAWAISQQFLWYFVFIKPITKEIKWSRSSQKARQALCCGLLPYKARLTPRAKGNSLKRTNSSTKCSQSQARHAGMPLIQNKTTTKRKLCAHFTLYKLVAARTACFFFVVFFYSLSPNCAKLSRGICTKTRKSRHNPESCRPWWSLTNQDEGIVCVGQSDRGE